MNIKNLLCVVSAMALFGAVTAQAQGLTDLAKAEKKRRAQVQKSGGAAKVYTESDRSSSSDAVSVANADTTGTAAPGAPGAPGAAAAPGGKKEKTPEEIAAEKQKEWNEKVTAAQNQITELEGQISSKERNLASLINITPARVDLANSIEADKKKLADLKQSLVTLEDERRRAGMPRR
jgi:hypothetical protein